MRYIIATGIVAVGPGFGRILMNWMDMEIFLAIQILSFIQLLTFSGFLIYDRVNQKKIINNPFFTALMIWLIPNVLIVFFPNTALWQQFAKWLISVI